MQFPKDENDGVMITYYEQLNVSTQIAFVDEIAFGVDVWAYDMGTLIELTHKLSDALCAIGLKRQFSSSDMTPEQTGSRYFRKTLRFGRKVDTRTNRLID